MREAELITIWQQQRLERAALQTEAGEPLQIVYPGRRNDGRGGDFRDAAIMLGGRLVTGDVEVHVRSQGWREHRHHRDPSYNSVILHVVMEPGASPLYLDNGWDIPTLALGNYIVGGAPEPPSWPCSGIVPGIAAAILDEMGGERFCAKVSQFGVELAQSAAGEVLYRGIMGALGYSRNRQPFIELAHRVPLQGLEALARTAASEAEGLRSLQAVLFGAAGLLPSQRRSDRRRPKDTEVVSLENEWRRQDRCGAMPAPVWELFRIRPANFPTRRLAGMARLVWRYRDDGLLNGIMRLLQQAAGTRDILLRGFIVGSEGYWRDHYDLGAAAKTSLPTLIGSDRADAIVLNILLPFAAALGGAVGETAAVLYRSYPRVAENSVERQMRQQLGLSRKEVNSAQKQQGLLQIYHTCCSQGKCGECALNRRSKE